MNVRVDENRFLSVACEPEERVVFDRQETKYHLLRDEAARLWDEIGDGGSFELAAAQSEAEDPIAQLVEAGLISIEADGAHRGISRRVWLTRTGKASAAAIVLPLVATIATPRFALGQDPGPSLEEGLERGSNNEPGLNQLEDNLSDFDRRQARRERRREQNDNNDTGTTTTGTPTTETPSTPAPTETTLTDRRAERRARRRGSREN